MKRLLELALLANGLISVVAQADLSTSLATAVTLAQRQAGDSTAKADKVKKEREEKEALGKSLRGMADREEIEQLKAKEAALRSQAVIAAYTAAQNAAAIPIVTDGASSYGNTYEIYQGGKQIGTTPANPDGSLASLPSSPSLAQRAEFIPPATQPTVQVPGEYGGGGGKPGYLVLEASGGEHTLVSTGNDIGGGQIRYYSNAPGAQTGYAVYPNGEVFSYRGAPGSASLGTVNLSTGSSAIGSVSSHANGATPGYYPYASAAKGRAGEPSQIVNLSTACARDRRGRIACR
jgi:hypothetical protein